MSYYSEFYGIEDLKEAQEYFAHPLLGKRLIELTTILLNIEGKEIGEIMFYPDDLKLRSSMTLFYKASGNSIFMDVINKYFDGKLDELTLKILEEKS